MSYNIDTATAEHYRALCIQGIRARIAIELEQRPGDAIIYTLEKRIDRVKREPLAAFRNAAFHGIDFTGIFCSRRASDAGRMYNEKAILKLLAVMRALDGSAFQTEGSDCGDDETTAGVVLALACGITEQKQIEHALNDYMNRPGRGRGKYAAGNTQASSSLRAMEAMHVVSFRNDEGKRESGRGGTKLWHIADAALFARLHDAAQGIYAHAAATAPLPIPVPVADPVPAPVPASVPMGWDSVDTSTPETPAPDAADADTVPMLTDAEVETLASDAAPDAAAFVNPYGSIDPDDYLAAPVADMPFRGKRKRATASAGVAA